LSATLWGVSFFDLASDAATALVPMSDTDFYVNGRYRTRLSFTVDDGGKVKSAIVNPGRSQQVGTRID
jgi:hypothetical protein